MNFYDDLVQIAKSALNYYHIEYTDLTEEMRIVERWVNVQLKRINPERRQIQKSPKFRTIILESVTSNALAEIEKKIIQGQDVNPYLSKTLFVKDYTDYLFYDWGIYHLHLSTAISDEGYFMNRSDQLLFITIRKNTVYFIDVLPHNKEYVFAQKELLEIIYKNWPNILEPYNLKGVNDLQNQIEDAKEIIEMRKAGLFMPRKIGNSVYAPMGGGLTTDATGCNASEETDRLYYMAQNAMGQAEDIVRSSPGKIFDFHIKLLPSKGFCIVDQNSDLVIPIRP